MERRFQRRGTQGRRFLPHRGAAGDRGRRSPRLRPSVRRRPSRHQAFEPHARRTGQTLDLRLRTGPLRRQRQPYRHRRRLGDPPLHEPGTGGGQAEPGRSADRRLLAGHYALRAGDAARGLRRRGPPGLLALDHGGRAPAAAAGQPGHPCRLGDDRAQGHRQAGAGPLPHGKGVGRRPAAVPGGRIDHGPQGQPLGPRRQMGPAAPHAGGRGGRGGWPCCSSVRRPARCCWRRNMPRPRRPWPRPKPTSTRPSGTWTARKPISGSSARSSTASARTMPSE